MTYDAIMTVIKFEILAVIIWHAISEESDHALFPLI